MSKSDTILIAVGGGEFAEAKGVFKEFLKLLGKNKDPKLAVMTVATNLPAEAAAKCNRLFRSHGVKHVDVVDISLREDAFADTSLKAIKQADALFFTGGDQLNVTSLMGGSPLHSLIEQRISDGFLVAGTSAGAAMMSSSMIASGKSDHAPQVGAVEIAPGMNLLSETIIDTHFSQRGRHGRLLTAVAHYPQNIGIGIDERTAILVRGNEFKVVGEGCVTIMDGSRMKHTDLPYREKGQTIGMFDVRVHVLPAGYRFDLHGRVPHAPTLSKFVGA